MSVADAVPANRRDPTGTATIRDRYAQHLRSAFQDLNTLVREGVRTEDVFGLTMDTLQDDLPPLARFDRDERKLDLFQEWLNDRIDDDVLTRISRGENRFIQAAYRRGVQDADRFMSAGGITVDGQAIDTALQLPVHQEALERLYTRNFENLKDITEVMSRQIGEELADGFAQGENPRAIARRITGRIDKIGQTRATVLARTEVINAHADATLNRYDQFGVSGVTIQAEWLTAGDQRVCPICSSLEGRRWTIEEARTSTITLTESDVSGAVPEDRSVSSFTGEFPVKPPAHPQCRCTLLPDTSS